MKLLIYFLFSLILLSCSKTSNIPVVVRSTAGSIEFKLNGELIRIDNINASSGETVGFKKQLSGVGLRQTRYLLSAQKKPGMFLSLTIVTDTLNTANYRYDSAFVNNNFSEFTFDLDNSGQFRSLYFSTDSVAINISSYKNSRVTGTFSARLSEVTGSLSDYNSRGLIYITDGEFNNVPVTY